MFYAASEIVFWILLSAIIGGGIGYGVSQAKSVQIGKRLTESRADAPMERELAIAWDTIEDLNKRLQVAHETIRAGLVDEATVADPDLFIADSPPSEAADVMDETPDNESPEVEDSAEETPSDDESELAAPLVHTVEDVVPADDAPEDGDESSDGAVGSRLADRVASASIGNQVEVVKSVEF